MRTKKLSAVLMTVVLVLSMGLSGCKSNKSKNFKAISQEELTKALESRGFVVYEHEDARAKFNLFADYSDIGVSVMFNYYLLDSEKASDEMFEDFYKMTKALSEEQGLTGDIEKTDRYIYAKYEVSGTREGDGKPDILVIKAENTLLLCYTNMAEEAYAIRKEVLTELGIKIEL